MHAGSPHINQAYIGNLVRRINAHEPDLILIGGDLLINGIIGGQKIPLVAVAAVLGSLKAKIGVFAVLGNHDWWNNGLVVRSELEKNGITVLENDVRYFKMNDGFGFWLVGIGDAFTQHADVPAALKQINQAAFAAAKTSPRILFMHDPAALLDITESFFLSFAGHMHGGQVYIPGYGAIITPGKAPKSWAQGWIDFPLGSLFVSKGIGTSIIPVRFNAPPEFVILSLSP